MNNNSNCSKINELLIKEDDNMPLAVAEQIELEHQYNQEFDEYQNMRLQYLNNLHTKTQEEQEAERQELFLKYQRIGILNNDGELAEFYRTHEDE